MTYCPTWIVGTAEIEGGLSFYFVLVVKETEVGRGYFQVHVQIVCDTDIRGGFGGTKTTWGRREYSISHIFIGLLLMVGFNGSLRFESWIGIQGCGVVVLVVLRVDGYYLEWNVSHKQKGFVFMRHGCFVGGESINDFLLDIFHMNYHGFGLIGYSYNKEGGASVMFDKYTMVLQLL